MRLLMAAMAVAGVAVLAAAPVHADPVDAPPFIDHTEWVHWADLSSLRVYPTPSGRAVAGELGGPPGDADEAWSEVLAMSDQADQPGMRAQFMCHWHWAELAEPGKASWNLEPWRPVVDDNQMIAAGCNPGGITEPF
jgi:Protein of unknown function (DUF2599)